MRVLSQTECEKVDGGFRLVLAGGALLAWTFSNRAALVEIAQAAKQRDAELDAEH